MPNPQKSVCLPIDIKFYDLTVAYSFFNLLKSEVFGFNEFILNPIEDGEGGKKGPPTSFSPVTFTNVGIRP